jgi:dihydropyrimidine dehydrogenase (NAD+) subunit PreA
MADLSVRFAGIYSPNPFWLASGPPSNSGDQVRRAFDLGWGGAVWKTVGEPIVNVCSRYSSIDYGGQRMMGLNNIELISDRPIADNLREIAQVKRQYPKHAVHRLLDGGSRSARPGTRSSSAAKTPAPMASS